MDIEAIREETLPDSEVAATFPAPCFLFVKAPLSQP